MFIIFQSITILLINITIKQWQIFNGYELYKIMFSLIKQVFIALLGFSRSLSTKCVSLKNEPCIVRPTLTELKRYPFVISLD